MRPAGRKPERGDRGRRRHGRKVETAAVAVLSERCCLTSESGRDAWAAVCRVDATGAYAFLSINLMGLLEDFEVFALCACQLKPQLESLILAQNERWRQA